MSNSIVIASEWQSMKDQANVLVRSGLLPAAVNTPEKAIVIMLQGRELGIGPMQALNGINVIKGKPTISPQLMLALINRSRELEDMVIVDDGKSCSVTMKRIGRTAHTETFSMQNAAAMGMSGKDNWQKQPAVMRKWRAVSACARVVFSDVINGTYTHEEISPDMTVDEDGDVVVTVEEERPQIDNASRALGMGYGEDDSTGQESALSGEQKQALISDYSGKEIADLKERTLVLLRQREPKMVEKHMINRWKKRFNTNHINEVFVTEQEFLEVMKITSEEWKAEPDIQPNAEKMLSRDEFVISDPDTLFGEPI